MFFFILGFYSFEFGLGFVFIRSWYRDFVFRIYRLLELEGFSSFSC